MAVSARRSVGNTRVMSGRARLSRPRGGDANEAVGEVAAVAAPAADKAKRVVTGKTTTDVVAGGFARAASQSTIHPLDTIKVRMQAPTAAVAGAAAMSAGKYGVGIGGAASRVQATVGSLYKGVGGAAGGAGVAIGAYFAFYGAASRFLQEHSDLALPTVAFIAGSCGALGSSIIKVPAAVCIRSVQANLYPNVIVAAKRIVKKAGVRGLFTGYLPTLIEDVPDMAVKFAAYESMRQAHERFTGRGREEAHKMEDLCMGGVAGAVAAGSTTPLDVIKTRMMVAAGSGKAGNIFSAGRAVLAESGVKGLLVGCGPRTISNFLNSGIFFVFFEGFRAALAKRDAEVQKREQAKLRQEEARAASAAAIELARFEAAAAAAVAAAAAPQGGTLADEQDDLDLSDVLCLARGGDRFAVAPQASLSTSLNTKRGPGAATA